MNLDGPGPPAAASAPHAALEDLTRQVAELRRRLEEAEETIRAIREDEVDAKMLVPGEGKTRVDDDDSVVGLDDHHVLSDLAETAEGNQPRCLAHAGKCSRVASWRRKPGRNRGCSNPSAELRSSS